MKVLFICNQNKNRSKTAEEFFSDKFETKSAGLFNSRPLAKIELEWADLVVVMEDSQREEIAKRFPKEYMSKKIVSMNISDVYAYKQAKLIEELKVKSEGLF